MLSNHSVNITNGVIISGDITTRHQFSWSQDLKSSCLIPINSSSLFIYLFFPFVALMYGKLRRLSHFLIKEVLLSFEISLPPHRVDGHRHRRHEPKPSSNVLNVSRHLSEVRIDQIFTVFIIF